MPFFAATNSVAVSAHWWSGGAVTAVSCETGSSGPDAVLPQLNVGKVNVEAAELPTRPIPEGV